MSAIVNGVLSLIGRLPFGVLYLLADILFVMVYHLVRYRRSLVMRNLSACFPDKSGEELKRIARDFYRNFADYFFETLKLTHISDSEMRRRMVFENTQVIDDILDRGRSVAVYFSHCGNWEWAPSVTLWSAHGDDPAVDYCQVYRPLANKVMDAWFLKIRSRFHSLSLPKRHVARELLKIRQQRHLWVTGFMSDQKPSHNDPTHVVEFLGRPTAVITGTEALARRLDMGVVYWDMHKDSRGHYRIVTRLITDRPGDMPPMGITDTYIAMLQETIRRNPSIWLWTHNRWKIPVTLSDTASQCQPNRLQS